MEVAIVIKGDGVACGTSIRVTYLGNLSHRRGNSSQLMNLKDQRKPEVQANERRSRKFEKPKVWQMMKVQRSQISSEREAARRTEVSRRSSGVGSRGLEPLRLVAQN